MLNCSLLKMSAILSMKDTKPDLVWHLVVGNFVAVLVLEFFLFLLFPVLL